MVNTGNTGSQDLVNEDAQLQSAEKGPSWFEMATITSLGNDLLAYIFLLMVQSSDSGIHLARTLAACKGFVQFGDDENILKYVSFSEERVTKNYKLFRKSNSLLLKCAQAGNFSARFLLAKVILLSTSEIIPMEGPALHMHVLEGDTVTGCRYTRRMPKTDTEAGLFLHHFLRAGPRSSQSFFFYEMVELFLSRCTIGSLLEMRVHLENYIDYFSVVYDQLNSVLHQMLVQVCVAALRVSQLQELSQLKRVVDMCMRDLGSAEAEARKRVGIVRSYMHYTPLYEASMKFWATHLVLNTKCTAAGIDCHEYFSDDADPMAFKRYVKIAFEHFEVCRENAAFAMTRMKSC